MRGRPRGEGKRAGGVARGWGRPGKRKKGSGLGQSGVRKWIGPAGLRVGFWAWLSLSLGFGFWVFFLFLFLFLSKSNSNLTQGK